jgi:hypothetical protein
LVGLDIAHGVMKSMHGQYYGEPSTSPPTSPTRASRQDCWVAKPEGVGTSMQKMVPQRFLKKFLKNFNAGLVRSELKDSRSSQQ